MSRSQFGTIKPYADGRWRVFWQQDGRKRSKIIDGSRDDAETYLARMKLESKGAVGDVPLREYWKIAVEPTFDTLSERTIYDYERLWRVELSPKLGFYNVSQLNWRTIERGLSEIGSPVVQRDAYRLLKKVCNLAVRDGLLKTNPVDRSIRLKPYKKREKVLYARDELLSLMRDAADYKHFYLVLLEIGGGLRHEEACAVLQSDLEPFESGGRSYLAVKVDKAMTTVGGKKVLKDPKNGFSVREAVIGEPFASALLTLRDKMPMQNPLAYQSNPITISRNWKRYCGRNGLKFVPFANMRTNFSVLHAEAGSLDSLVSLAMGHSGGTTRARNYLAQTRAGLVLIADSLTDYLL